MVPLAYRGAPRHRAALVALHHPRQRAPRQRSVLLQRPLQGARPPHPPAVQSRRWGRKGSRVGGGRVTECWRTTSEFRYEWRLVRELALAPHTPPPPAHAPTHRYMVNDSDARVRRAMTAQVDLLERRRGERDGRVGDRGPRAGDDDGAAVVVFVGEPRDQPGCVAGVGGGSRTWWALR